MFKLIIADLNTGAQVSFKYPSLDEVVSHIHKLDFSLVEFRIETVR